MDAINHTFTVEDKRLLRREKQRQSNHLRAEKMHKARMQAGYDFIPAHITIGESGQRIHMGCSGWFYWDWKDCFYPEGMPTSEWFAYYTSQFSTVELNAPFYSWPTVNAVKAWAKGAGDGEFIYTVKVCELITHIKRFEDVTGLIEDFGFIADMLGPRMGCFLYQLPPNFHYTPERLHLIVSQLDLKRRNVVEFRHSSWWHEDVYTAFRAAGIIFCSISAPKLPEVLVKTTDDIYLRFHGPEKWYRHDYSNKELDAWAQQIRDSDAKNIWIYFNNAYDCYAVKNAHELLKLLQL